MRNALVRDPNIKYYRLNPFTGLWEFWCYSCWAKSAYRDMTPYFDIGNVIELFYVDTWAEPNWEREDA